MSLVVRADVVDIGRHTPTPADNLLVDTNVWFDLVYTTRTPDVLQTSYQRFLAEAVWANASLACVGLSLPEMAHIIEREECRRHFGRRSLAPRMTKEFRRIPDERRRVVEEIAAAWSQIEALATLQISIMIDPKTTASAIAGLAAQQIDGYDIYFLEALRDWKLSGILTDDSVFCSVPGITVFTANKTVLAEAKEQGRLSS